MIDFRQELEEVLQMKDQAGFHYIYKVEQLAKKAREARQWKNIVRKPITSWISIMKDTRFVLDKLEAS